MLTKGLALNNDIIFHIFMNYKTYFSIYFNIVMNLYFQLLFGLIEEPYVLSRYHF